MNEGAEHLYDPASATRVQMEATPLGDGTVLYCNAGNPPFEGEPLPSPAPAQPAADSQPDAAVPGVGTPKVKKRRPLQWGGTEEKKFRPSDKMRAAIFEVIARTEAGWKADYRGTAERHGVNAGSLGTLVLRYRKGGVDLGEKIAIEKKLDAKKEIDIRAEMHRRMALLGEYERHLDDVLNDLLKKAKKEYKEGNLLAFDQLQLPKVVAQLGATSGLRTKLEKGVLEILTQLLEAQARRDQLMQPQQTKGTVIVEGNRNAMAAVLAPAGDHQKIREALQTIEESEVAAAAEA